ncbi:MAG TPA: J domain-containing protein [Polyangia bacterium]
MVGEALRVIGRSIEADIARTEAEGSPPPSPPPPIEPIPISDDADSADAPRVESAKPEPPPPVIDDATASAAAALGVSVDATADEIRAALRARLSSSRLHPDQGGDGEEAKRLIAAKNHLVARARAVRP